MRNKFTAVILVLLLAVSVFANENASDEKIATWDDSFRKFSMGLSLGLGPSYLKGAEKYYDAEKSEGFSMMFEMAYPVTDNMALRAIVGFDGIFGLVSEYEYVHREVRDSIMTNDFEIALLWNVFLTQSFFVGVGPSVRFPWIEEVVEVEGDEVFSGEVDYSNDLWLDAMIDVGFKFGCIELGLRSGYEFLGLYKETKKYDKVDIHELRFRFYLAYWFGQKNN
jgi:hypothetical protein